MRPTALAALLSVALVGSALAAGMTVKDEMKTVVDPATNTIFAVGAEVDPANGPDAARSPQAAGPRRWRPRPS